MTELISNLKILSAAVSISGYESYSGDTLKNLFMPYFDEFKKSVNNNFLFIKRCGKPKAPSFLIDAHYDEVGMMITEIKEKGFIRVTNLGGIDTRIMLAGEVKIYGSKKSIYGVVCVTPPHLQKPGDSKHLPEINELLIDTGYTDKELAEMGIGIGTPVGYSSQFTELLGGLFAGKSFDNKVCVAAAAEAVRLLSGKELDFDIYLLCSCKEETSALGGRIGAFSINPEACIVLDVNLAHVPDTKRHETVKMGEGPSVSLSAVTDRSLTKAIIETAKENQIKYQTVVEATDTGTNANVIAFVKGGIPTAVVSIPLKNMHTYSEVISSEDAELTALLVSKFIEAGASKWMKG